METSQDNHWHVIVSDDDPDHGLSGESVKPLSVSFMVAAPEPAPSPPPAFPGAEHEYRAADLLIALPPVSQTEPCEAVLQSLLANRDWPARAVIDADGAVVGLVVRSELLSVLARLFMRDLYRRRPIAALMVPAPLIVDCRDSIDEIGRLMATDHPDALVQGFVITDNGHYAGIGTATDFMRRQVAQAEHRAVELEEARYAAEQANAAKSSFLANISHEIRTPLNGVLGNLELLKLTNLAPDQGELVHHADVAAQTLLEIIGDVLDFSKIEAGRLDLDLVETSPAGIVSDVITLLASRARQNGIVLRHWLGPDVPRRINADPLRLRQILMNLVGNAIKFTHDGSILVSLTCSRDPWARRPDLRFEVSDSGIGFAPAKAAGLFDAFTQADGSTTRRFGGTGLGLAICRKLVLMMEGAIDCDGWPDGGASFWFTVPVTVVEAAPALTKADTAGARVLVVSGHPAMQPAMERALGRVGVEVTVVDTRDAALEALEQAAARDTPFAVIFVALDEVAAITLAQQAAPVLGATVLAALSEQGEPRTRRRYYRAGYTMVLAMPVPVETLRHAVAVRSGHLTLAESTAAAVNAADLHGLAQRWRDRASHERVLVIDDTEMNRLVARRQLQTLGITVDLAENGRVGLDLAMRNDYAVIFTDVQMAEMDGLSFARHFRVWESDPATPRPGHRTPIVAMTAAAMRSDADDCLAAGMDDYIAKPVKLERLAQLLERWAGAGTAAVPADTVAADSAGIPARPADLTAQRESAPVPDDEALPIDLDQLIEIVGVDDPAILVEMIGFFQEALPDLLSGIAAPLAARDREGLRQGAHACKGAARNAAAADLAAALEILERESRTASWIELDALGLRAASAGSRVLDYIRDFSGLVGTDSKDREAWP